MEYLHQYAKRLKSHGWQIITVSPAETRREYGGLRTFSQITSNKNDAKRLHRHKFMYPCSELDSCAVCGKIHRRNRSIYEMPWFHRYALMVHEYNSFLTKFQMRHKVTGVCCGCLSNYYRLFKAEFNNLKTKSLIATIGKEIRCQSKLLET